MKGIAIPLVGLMVCLGYACPLSAQPRPDWAVALVNLDSASYDFPRILDTAIDRDGNLIVAGMATGAIDLDGDGQPNFITRGTTDLFVARYTPTGALSWAHNAGGDWSLAFNDLHDVLGRHVDSLHQGFLPAGEHRFIIDGNALPAGLYAVRLRGEALTARRLIVRVP